MKLSRSLAVLGLGAGALVAASTPALAGSSVDVSLTATGTRTLNLYQPDGKTQLTATDLSSGGSNFIAQVQDSSYNNQQFTVQATMSNLYPYPNGSYQCTGGPAAIPSSAITLSSPSGLLTVGGVSAALTPVFTMSGQLTSTILPLVPLGSPVTLTGTTVSGALPGGAPISQSTLTGSSGSLFGSALSSAQLPISVSSLTTGGNFANPDAHPTCQPTVSTPATPVPMMHGAPNPTGLVGDLTSEISAATCSGTPLGTSPTLSSLICAGYLTSNAVSTALQANTTLMSDLGGLTGLTANLATIENSITAPINGSNVSLLSGATSQSGTYDASPSLQVSVPTGSSGTYKGVMTVTLVDG